MLFLKKPSAPNKAYIFAIILQFLIDWLKRNILFFFFDKAIFLDPCAALRLKSSTSAHCRCKSLRMISAQKTWKDTFKEEAAFLYTRRYSCNILFNTFVLSFQHNMVGVFLQFIQNILILNSV